MNKHKETVFTVFDSSLHTCKAAIVTSALEVWVVDKIFNQWILLSLLVKVK